MKKIILTLFITFSIITNLHAQLLPKFQLGIKGGVTVTDLTDIKNGDSYISRNLYNKAGFVGGFWARVGAAGIFFQPEIYLTSKNISYTDHQVLANASAISGPSYRDVNGSAKLTSIDIPLLVGTKFGVLGSGLRLNTGPVISFAVNKNYTILDNYQSNITFAYKDQNYAWQFGAGFDVLRFSVDARYEAGISQIENNYGDKRHISLYSFTLGYKIF